MCRVHITTLFLKCSAISVSATISRKKRSTGQRLGIDPAKLSAAVYTDDYEAAKIWLEEINESTFLSNLWYNDPHGIEFLGK